MPEVLAYANRNFEFGDSAGDSWNASKEREQKGSSEKLVEYVREQIVGEGKEFASPFGSRKMTYCDFTASGKSLGFIEDYIRDQVLPYYGNTHTTTSVTGRQSTFFRHESREIIKQLLHGNEDNVLLFTGTGATGAVHKLIGCLGLDQLPVGDLVVFVGPYEHHSNLLPWRELNAKVITIPETTAGQIDINALEASLVENIHYNVKVGAFSAASNVTGVLSDQNAISACLHRHDALAFWDFAAAGPYLPIDMNPVIEGPERHLVYKDAIFLSPHKFVGGASTPGILLARRNLFQRPSPKECGGGTVFFVSREDHRYLNSIEEREESGTPDIVGSIRCGLIFRLKQQIGDDFIFQREKELVAKAKESLVGLPGFVSLGPHEIDRLPIFSFLIEHKDSGLYLHHNFVCAVLNDVFGIQVRGGCVCSGPYAQELLGIDYQTSKQFENALLKLSAHDKNLEGLLPRERDRKGAGTELLRPGFVRLNFHYSMDDSCFDFVISALKMIATEGWKLLPLYNFNLDTGEWMHRSWSLQRDRKWIGSINFFGNDGEPGLYVPKNQHRGKVQSKTSEIPTDRMDYYKYCLEEAHKLLSNIPKSSMDVNSELLLFDNECSKLRWFLLPSEANAFLSSSEILPSVSPFKVKIYESPIQNAVLHPEKSTEEPEESNETKEKTDAVPIDYEFFDIEEDEDVENEKPSSNNSYKFHVPSKKLMHSTLTALDEHAMIKHGDRVIVCVSGGKDSLSMLHILKYYQYYMKARGVEFDLAAATVDPQTPSTFDPSPLKVYMKALGMTYFYLSDSIMERARNAEECKSICSYCSRMKRGILYSCARKEGYNVLALGQHLDDISESFLMSLFFNGSLRTMKANYTIEEGDLRVIRPLVDTRERDLAQFASEKKLPVIPENCPACFEAPKERHRLKQLLANQENLHKNIFQSIKIAIKPLVGVHHADRKLARDNPFEQESVSDI